MRKDLHVIALKIFQFCVDNEIELEVQWIPRTKLDRADFISRIIDVDDWQITTSFFEFLDYTWGRHTVDCFANFYNKKIKKFYSRFWNPGCSGVDFFVQNLTGEDCLVVPQMFTTQGYWDNIPDHVKPNTKDLLTLLMKSKVDSTVKRHTKEIVKFSRWCNLVNCMNKCQLGLPEHPTIIPLVLYFYSI
ncbi:uncharacterized protein LOC111321503 [Stylophora pistillata]|uniref:uncharacterized protein LOC111321503 n=1 Tax=Stylophora pistillata TaxID=50429 RepID=UPI000C041EB4|nr:uncharacterized protein LOC111321503 [Stylophora pistillata]